MAPSLVNGGMCYCWKGEKKIVAPRLIRVRESDQPESKYMKAEPLLPIINLEIYLRVLSGYNLILIFNKLIDY